MTVEAAVDVAINENREAPDYRFSPLIDRLERIFQVPLTTDRLLATAATKRFLELILSCALIGVSLPALAQLRGHGVRTGIVSNAPWGSPPELWRQGLDRLGLSDVVDAVVLRGDVGWRKPSPVIFKHAAEKLGCLPAQCMFVGDDLRWDIEGSASVGMRPVLIDRDGRHPEYAGERVADLHGVLGALGAIA